MDDDEKIRRNLIVTSAIIIGVVWFNVSVPDLLDKLFSIKGSAPSGPDKVPEWKVWVAAFIALGYMTWRYRWSDEVEIARQQFDISVIARYGVLFQRVYLRDLAEWIRVGLLPTDSHPTLVVLYGQATPQVMVEQLGRRPDYVRLRAREPASPFSEYGGVEVTAGTRTDRLRTKTPNREARLSTWAASAH